MDKLMVKEAYDNYTNIVRLRKSINNNFWELVERLKTVRENRQWALLGHESWASYLAQPEVDFNQHTVDYWLTIFNSIKEYQLQWPDIVNDIDSSKLAIVAPYINKDNAEEMLLKAKNLSRSDLRKEIQEAKFADLPIVEIPEGKFNVIYADPPWKYDFSATTNRNVENHYPTMELSEIKEMIIPATDNCTLFLWATAPKLPEALEVMSAWGFNYKTHMVWDKDIIGMGYWFRGQHELLLVGVKGIMSVLDEGSRVSSVYKERRGEHSKKPGYFYNLIESYFPNGKYLELFAREKHNDKWTVYGNQIK